MLLAIDIGNTNVTIGLAEREEWRHVWRLPTSTEADALLFYETRLADWMLEAEVPPERIRQCVISSVVPDLAPIFDQLTRTLFQQVPVLVGPAIYPQLPLLIERPHELGTDLLANALAAYCLYRRDCIVVDFGTALTFTSVNEQGRILGVSIAPGLRTAIGALYQKTAQLPEVPLELPPSAVGKDTITAIQSGVLMGYVGLVRHLLEAIRGELGAHYIAVATGGLSSILHPLRGDFDFVEPHLTLHGLRLIGGFVADYQR